MTDTTRPTDLSDVIGELRGLLARASTGPWRQHPTWGASDVLDGVESSSDGAVAVCEMDYDAALIVAMHNHLPALLDALEGRDAVREALRFALDHLNADTFYGDVPDQFHELATKALAGEPS